MAYPTSRYDNPFSLHFVGARALTQLNKAGLPQRAHRIEDDARLAVFPQADDQAVVMPFHLLSIACHGIVSDSHRRDMIVLIIPILTRTARLLPRGR